MKSEWNICALFGLLVLWAILSSCTHNGRVTPVEPCVEIPFQDGPEGACVNTVTHKSYLVDAKAWAEMRPTMIMLRASDWTEIKKDWLAACRMMIRDGDRCNVVLDTVDTAVKKLDDLIKMTRK